MGSARVRLKVPKTKKYITWEVAMVLYVFIMLYDDLFNHRI